MPWSSVSMRESRRRHAHHRRLRARATCTSAANAMRAPASRSESAVFLSDFRRIEISQYDAGRELRLRALRDRASPIWSNDDTQFKAGADITWKASPNLWLGGDAQSRLRPGRERRAGGRLLGDRDRVHRQAAVLHREPGHLRSAHAGQRPAHLHAPHRRRAGRRQRRVLRHRCRAEADRHGGLAGVRRVRRAGRRLSTRTSAACSPRRALALPLRARARRLSGHLDRSSVARSRRAGQRGRLRADAERLVARRRSGHSLRYRRQAGVGSSRRLRSLAADRLQPLRAAHAHAEAAVHRRSVRPERSGLHGAQLAAPGRVGDESSRSSAPPTGRISGETQRLYLYYRENDAGQRLQSRVQLSRDVQYASAWRAYEELRYLTERRRRSDLARQRAGAARRPRRAAMSTSPRRASATGSSPSAATCSSRACEDYSGLAAVRRPPGIRPRS